MREPSEPGLWRNRNWRLLWLGQSVSKTGDMVFTMTVLLWIATIIAKGQTWAPAAASGALIATAAPVLVVGPLAGVFVDRWNRRRTMLIADAARCALIAGLLILPLLRHTIAVGAQLAILYVVLAICSCFAEFFDPSRLAVLGAIVPSEQQPKASAQLSAAFSTAQVIGPPIAAPLLITFGVQWALILNAASFAFSFWCVRAIRLPQAAAEQAQETRASFIAEFKEGIQFFAASRVLVTVAIGVVIALLGNGAVNSLAVFFIPHNLHAPASWLGTISAGVGAGAILGALAAAAIAGRIRPGQLFWLALTACGLALIAFSRATALAPAIAFAGCLGLGAGVLNAVIGPILLSATPAHMLGRVSAVLSPLMQLAEIVSMILAGALASTVLRGVHFAVAGVRFGPYDTVFAVAGLLFVIGGISAIAPMRRASQPAAASEADTDAGPALPAPG
ncbi:MAG TPA: MFS transporter [Streptosporangiaceae bacterium]|nr:MFS transporter [Streptosporangiaceae bacterium]